MIQNPIKQDISFRVDDSSGIQIQVIITVIDELEHSIEEMAILAVALRSDVVWQLRKIRDRKVEKMQQQLLTGEKDDVP